MSVSERGIAALLEDGNASLHPPEGGGWTPIRCVTLAAGALIAAGLDPDDWLEGAFEAVEHDPDNVPDRAADDGPLDVPEPPKPRPIPKPRQRGQECAGQRPLFAVAEAPAPYAGGGAPCKPYPLAGTLRRRFRARPGIVWTCHTLWSKEGGEEA